jgi:hypothetical protein
MGSQEADVAVAQAIAAETTSHAHDPRIDDMFRKDVIIIYVFVALLWVVIWGVFIAAVTYMDDPLLIIALVGLGVFACAFNTVGMVQNTRRLAKERVRFYSQDLYWQDQKKAQKK